ncbi:MAG: hypothetical protein KDC54_07510 [Lewinella sp.]|nr:hypothetical protein [Lewinella sp.]
MANGIDFTDAAAYKAYVEDFAMQLFTRLFYGFRTSQLATPVEGVKGRHILTELIVNSGLAKRWAATFVGTANTSYKPYTLTVARNKVEHYVIPQEFESTYLGMMRRSGQDPTDYPFEAYTLGKILDQLAVELENAFWQGEAAVSPASTDLLAATFDGILTQVADAITATDLTETSTGVITEADVLDQFRALWAVVNTAQKNLGTDIFVSYPVYDLYRIKYKKTYGADPAYVKIDNSNYEQGIRYEMSSTAQIIPIPGMGTSQRIIIMPRERLFFGYDALADWGNFRFEQNHRQLDYWCDFNFGALAVMLRDGACVVNDQA